METSTLFDSYCIGEIRTYLDGETVIEEGDSDSGVYVIMKGAVKVRKRSARGMVTIDRLKEGGRSSGKWFFSEGGMEREARR
jgi:CRP-like cAMP-binding protein